MTYGDVFREKGGPNEKEEMIQLRNFISGFTKLGIENFTSQFHQIILAVIKIYAEKTTRNSHIQLNTRAITNYLKCLKQLAERCFFPETPGFDLVETICKIYTFIQSK